MTSDSLNRADLNIIGHHQCNRGVTKIMKSGSFLSPFFDVWVENSLREIVLVDGSSLLRKKQRLIGLDLKEDGTALVGNGGCTLYKIYKDTLGNVFLGVDQSLPKRMYETDLKNDGASAGAWRFVIEDIRGYLSGQPLINTKNEIKKSLAKHNITLPQVPWYKLPEAQTGIYFQDEL